MNERLLVFFVVKLVIAAFLGDVLAARWKNANPTKRPYAWGYMQGICGVLNPLAVVAATTEGEAQFLLAFGVLDTVFGLGILNRQRWGWIGGTILGFNPVYWCINALYASHRWGEMKEEAKASKLERRAREQAVVEIVADRLPILPYPESHEMPGAPFQRAGWSLPRDPRVIALLLFAAFMAGFGAHMLFGERYRFQAIGNGAMMKSDRWTGDSWLMRTYTGEWQPVR